MRAAEMLDGGAQCANSIDRYLLDDSSFERVGIWDQETRNAERPRSLCHSQDPWHGSYRTVQGQFSDGQVTAHGVRWHLTGGDQDREGDGQVERRPFFAPVAGGQVDDDSPGWQIEPRISNR